MASKTSLPIARLRSLGCRVSTLLGHWPTAPVSPEFRYSVTLPAGLDLAEGVETRDGYAKAYVFHDGRIIVEAFVNVERNVNLSGKAIKSDRIAAEAQVAGLLNAIADALSKAGK